MEVVNRFGRWIVDRGKTRDQAASQLGISKSYLHNLCRNVRRPSLDLALRIERFTGGEIPAAWWARAPKHSSG